jgi:hypothetical protein
MLQFKVPVVRKRISPTGAQGALNIETDLIKNVPKNKSSEVGIVLIIVTICLLLQLYISGKPTWPDKLTLSHTFEFAGQGYFGPKGKYMSIGLLLLFTVLLVYFLMEKGFFSKNASDIKKSLAGISFAILGAFLTLFIIVPEKSTLISHAFMAMLVLFFLIFLTLSFFLVYGEIYENEGLLKDLENIMASMVVFTLLIFVCFLVEHQFPSCKRLAPVGIAGCEVIIMVLFISALGIMTVMPEMYDLKMNCLTANII